MYCNHCGQEIDVAGKFCPHCGAPVDEAQKTEGKQAKPKKVKKPFYKRWWFWVIVVILLLGSCSGGSDTPAETTPATQSAVAETTAETAETTMEAVETTAVVETVAATEAVEVDSATLDAAVSLIKTAVGDNFKNFEIYHENNIITINIWEDGIAFGASLVASGNVENAKAWDDLVENQKEFCKSICDFVDTLGLDDVMVMVNVLNDGNRDNVLLSVAEGVVVYNCVND